MAEHENEWATSKFEKSSLEDRDVELQKKVIATINFIFQIRYKPKKIPNMPSCSHPNKKFECRMLQNSDIMGFRNNYYKSINKVGQDSFILAYCSFEVPQRTNRHAKNGSRKEISIKNIKFEKSMAN